MQKQHSLLLQSLSSSCSQTRFFRPRKPKSLQHSFWFRDYYATRHIYGQGSRIRVVNQIYFRRQEAFLFVASRMALRAVSLDGFGKWGEKRFIKNDIDTERQNKLSEFYRNLPVPIGLLLPPPNLQKSQASSDLLSVSYDPKDLMKSISSRKLLREKTRHYTRQEHCEASAQKRPSIKTSETEAEFPKIIRKNRFEEDSYRLYGIDKHEVASSERKLKQFQVRVHSRRKEKPSEHQWESQDSEEKNEALIERGSNKLPKLNYYPKAPSEGSKCQSQKFQLIDLHRKQRKDIEVVQAYFPQVGSLEKFYKM